MRRTKAEVRAAMEEVRQFSGLSGAFLETHVVKRLEELEAELGFAEEDMFSSVIRSHVAVCKAKDMGEKEAYGQDPALYYSAAISAEAGEQLNKLIRGLRNGNDPEVSKRAVISELPDIFIYGHVLSFVLDLDIEKLVSEKAEVVIKRAESGYYGGPLLKRRRKKNVG